MIPKYAFSCISARTLKHCMERTLEETRTAFLDWKGIRSEDKPGVIDALLEINLPYEKV
jgi:D-tyrosyl-tRNA(Tyr) deacylase